MMQKSLRQLARDIEVSPSYLSQVLNGKRPASDRVAKALCNWQLSVKQNVKQNRGGSAWESNPPETSEMPPNGVEVREAHRDLCAPD